MKRKIIIIINKTTNSFFINLKQNSFYLIPMQLKTQTFIPYNSLIILPHSFNLQIKVLI